MTSQVNVVRPGGKAQDPHRDYHLGFLSNEVAARYPAHVHLLSPVLTLQGAVAHSDMPVESGPTMYLPVLPPVRPRLPGLAAAGVPRVLRRPVRPAAAGQGRRRVLQPGAVPRRRATTCPPTCSGWRTCCRCPRRSAGRWRPSTGSRWRRRSTRCCGPAAPPASTRRSLTQRDQLRRGGLPVPEQPRPGRERRTASRPLAQTALLEQALTEDWRRGPGRSGARRVRGPAPHRRDLRPDVCRTRSYWSPDDTGSTIPSGSHATFGTERAQTGQFRAVGIVFDTERAETSEASAHRHLR